MKPNVKIIVASSEDYFVIIDKELSIDWETSDKFEQETHESKEKMNELKNDIFALECIPVDHHLENIIVNYKRLLGEALVRVFELDFSGSRSMIEQARRYIETRNIEVSRQWILETSFKIIPVYLLMVFTMCSLMFYKLIPVASFTTQIILSFIIGGLSACLSLTQRLGRTSFDFYAARKSHRFECIAKSVVGSFSGSLAFLAIKLGVIVPLANVKSANTTIYFCFFAFAAGATERFIPSIIDTIKVSKKEE